MFKKHLITITILIVLLFGGILVYASFLDKEEPVKPVDNTLSNNISEPDDNNEDNQDQIDDVNDNDVPEIDISDWKTYRNEEFGFEIKYPLEFSSWEAPCSPKRSEIIDIGFRPEDMGGSVLMITILNIPLQELSAYEHSVYGDLTDEKIKIGNLTATKFSGQRIGIEKNKHTFFFSSHNIREEDSEIFYQMLSTFKFINP